MRIEKTDKMFWFLVITGIMLIAFMSGINKFLTENKPIAIIDDGKVKDRIVWVPENAGFYGKFDFNKLSSSERQKFIDAMNSKNYAVMLSIFNKYKENK